MAGNYTKEAYDRLSRPAQSLYDWLVRYHQQHGGRRASRAEMRKALGLYREELNDLVSSLELADLFTVERDDRGKARSYKLPGERWTHPHLVTLEMRKTVYPGTLLDQ